MGSISMDPSELAAAGSSLRSVAAAFAGGVTQISLGHVAGPQATAAQLPDFAYRWTRWIGEVEEVITDLATGLAAAGAYYEQRERDIAAWTRP